MLASSEDLLANVAEKVNDSLHENYTLKAIKAFLREDNFSQKHVEAILVNTFGQIFIDQVNYLSDKTIDDVIRIAQLTKDVTKASKKLVEDGYYRTDFTSAIVGEFINGIVVKHNTKFPMLSKASLPLEYCGDTDLNPVFQQMGLGAFLGALKL